MSKKSNRENLRNSELASQISINNNYIKNSKGLLHKTQNNGKPSIVPELYKSI